MLIREILKAQFFIIIDAFKFIFKLITYNKCNLEIIATDITNAIWHIQLFLKEMFVLMSNCAKMFFLIQVKVPGQHRSPGPRLRRLF